MVVKGRIFRNTVIPLSNKIGANGAGFRSEQRKAAQAPFRLRHCVNPVGKRYLKSNFLE